MTEERKRKRIQESGFFSYEKNHTPEQMWLQNSRLAKTICSSCHLPHRPNASKEISSTYTYQLKEEKKNRLLTW